MLRKTLTILSLIGLLLSVGLWGLVGTADAARGEFGVLLLTADH